MINYDLTKIKALVFDVDGVLSASTINVDTNGDFLRTTNVKDGYAMHLAVKMGFHIAIITGGGEESIALRYGRIGMEDIYLSSFNKTERFQMLLEKYNLAREEVLYMGDDIPDYEVMKQVGLPCCPRDAAPEIREISLYISHLDGGKGCVRDVIEQVMKAQKKWMADEKAFCW